MTYYNRSGVPFITLDSMREMKRGQTAANCLPPEESAPYPTPRKKGDVNAKLPE
jgi:hypothetical protein